MQGASFYKRNATLCSMTDRPVKKWLIRWSVITAILGSISLSFAQIAAPPGASNSLATVLFAIEDMRIRLDNFQILTEYCKPPHAKNKLRTQAILDFEERTLKTLEQRFAQVEKGFVTAGNTRAGFSFRGSFPVINGFTAEDRNYWPSARALLTQVQTLLGKKQKQLQAAPERDCQEQPKQSATKPAQAPVDPLAGLKRPMPRPTIIPTVPAYFCSEAERRQWYLDNFAAAWNDAAENVGDATRYRAEASDRATKHFNKDGDKANQQKLDAEERWADRNLTQQVRARELVDSTRDVILNTPIIDCSLLVVRDLVDQSWHEANVERVQAAMKEIDGRIEDLRARIAEAKTDARKLADEFSQGGDLEGQYYFDLSAEFDNLNDWIRRSESGLKELLFEKAAIQGELQRAVEARDAFQQADARTVGTPRLTPEPRQIVEDNQPGWLEKLAPALVPSIGVGVGGRRGGEPDRRYPDRR
jgi:hypothetical protein